MLKLVIASLLLCASSLPSYACGVSSDCTLSLPDENRTYRIAMPDTANGKPGAVIFAHGYRGTAAGTMRNKGVINALNERGVAFVAAQAGDEDWQLHNRPRRGPNVEGQKREMAYFEAAESRSGGKPRHRWRQHHDRPVFPPVAWWRGPSPANWATRLQPMRPSPGTFWKPVPQSCPGLPVPMIHIHGTADRTVPLKGRASSPTARRATSITRWT